MKYLKLLESDEVQKWYRRISLHGVLDDRKRELAVSCIPFAYKRASYLVDRCPWLDRDTADSMMLEWLCEAAASYNYNHISEHTGRPVRFMTFVYTHVNLKIRGWMREVALNASRVGLCFEADSTAMYKESGDAMSVTQIAIDPHDFVEELVERDETKARMKKLAKLLNVLDKRSKFVVMANNGFFGREPWSFVKIADHLGVTRERVRQIAAKAMYKLRKHAGKG